MLRIASALLLTLLGCSPRGAPTGQSDENGTIMTPSAPKTTLEQVQQAYRGARVSRAEINVPGVELFQVMRDRVVPQDADNLPTIVAITSGVGSPMLSGRDAMRAVINGTKDPMVLAQAAMAIERRGGELLTAPKNDEQTKQNVGPPVLDGNTVTFWIWTSGVGRMLEHAKVDLTTGAFDYIAGPAPTQDEKIAKAIEWMRSTSRSYHSHALEVLGPACGTDAKARAALLDAIAHQKDETARAGAVDASSGCGAEAIDTLVQAMEKDAAPTVRWKAATALGKIGDAKAKPALEKATKAGDDTVKRAATEALGKLK